MSSNRHNRKFVMVVPEQFIGSKGDLTQQQQQQQSQYLENSHQNHRQHQQQQQHQQQHQQQQQQLKIHQEMVHLQQQQQQQQQSLDNNNMYLPRFNQQDQMDNSRGISIQSSSSPATTATTATATTTTTTTTGSAGSGTGIYDTGLTQFDLKSKDSKYKRWTPRMDQYLIKLLSDVVHSYPRGADPEMNKKAWLYVCKQLRQANPETVYSTYSKYSIQQHLINVIHHRYKIWYKLILHTKLINQGYTYKWNAELGKFQILDLTNKKFIYDLRQVKLILYSDSLNLPNLNHLSKSNLISNDFFLSDNLKYISVYHNEILPVLIKLDPKFVEDFDNNGENLYRDVPKFGHYPEANNEFFKPLVPVKKNTGVKRRRKEGTTIQKHLHSQAQVQAQVQAQAQAQGQGQHFDPRDVNQDHNDHDDEDDEEQEVDQQDDDHDHDDNNNNNIDQGTHSQSQSHGNVVFGLDVLPLEESVDPDLKRARMEYQVQNSASLRRAQIPIQQQQLQQVQQQRSQPQIQSRHHQTQTQTQLQQQQQQQRSSSSIHMNIDIENALTSATIAAMNAPPIKSSKSATPYYIKDAKWFNKLMSLYDSGQIRADEVLSICEGVRDNKIPLFMLNVLDHDYYPTRTNDGSTATVQRRDIPDDETTKRIREFMLPMVYNS